MLIQLYALPEPRIVYEDDDVIVVTKPGGVHCAPASEPGSLSAWLFERHPETAGIKGRNRGEGGLVHRLDHATTGLVAFARSEHAFDALLASGRDGTFIKSYRAICEPAPFGLRGSKPELGVPEGADGRAWLACLRKGDVQSLAAMLSGTTLRSFFRAYGPGRASVACLGLDHAPARVNAKSKPFTRDLYSSECFAAEALVSARPVEAGGAATTAANEAGTAVLASLRLTRGFRHQIRAHMAWIGLPLRGDPVYGSEGGPLGLLAYRLEFPSPTSGGTIVVDLDGLSGRV